ncbi:MAG TPA: DUF4189 domain-containing protein [Burkholderiales bacterium]|nr:DUF4189 domain-containing protein [Burkholderiales bacterium]
MQRKLFVKLGLAAALALAVQGTALANGALAIDGNQGDQYGFSYNHPSMGAAEQRALGECGSGCNVVLRFSSGCAAYAADQSRGSSIYGWYQANSGGSAQNGAMNECRSRGGRACQVRAWGCNSR